MFVPFWDTAYGSFGPRVIICERLSCLHPVHATYEEERSSRVGGCQTTRQRKSAAIATRHVGVVGKSSAASGFWQTRRASRNGCTSPPVGPACAPLPTRARSWSWRQHDARQREPRASGTPRPGAVGNPSQKAACSHWGPWGGRTRREIRTLFTLPPRTRKRAGAPFPFFVRSLVRCSEKDLAQRQTADETDGATLAQESPEERL